jgi:mono/diheme cytochrome c family protein
MRRAMFALLPLVALTAPAAAQTDIGDPQAGRRLAETWCANCHRVAPAGPGPVTDSAPAFGAVAAMPSTTVMSLRVFLQTPHANMPDYRLTREQTDNLIAYILSLRGR